jgi:hypothetical protein
MILWMMKHGIDLVNQKHEIAQNMISFMNLPLQYEQIIKNELYIKIISNVII